MIDFMRFSYERAKLCPYISGVDEEAMRGVRINCKRSTEILQRRRYAQVKIRNVPVSLVFVDTPHFMKRLKIPSKRVRKEPGLSWRHNHANAPLLNWTSWVFNPKGRRGKGGSVLIARTDGKPLYPEHIAAILFYCQDITRDLDAGFFRNIDDSEHVYKERLVRVTEQKCTALSTRVSKADFLAFYHQWLSKYRAEGVRQVPDPYSV
ncbi:hypothetical protein EJ04DRAFT_159088 [Polyplosphaeria fusca]|uniref:Uncharacterized protein n=1 Tax=Polyplosphaeria fusca TaxID=682080 RepID=A0A9P4QYT8_9PLEO|nr:hypothetical protein EJ04DRAFT_159088 [Polyplosphaeria fusca]